jgi:NAD(P)H-hydrate epimerase
MPTAQSLPPLPDRPEDGHKGTFGRVLIVGGSRAMAGAPILSGRAALRTGSGLVQLAFDDLMHTASIAACPELIGLPGANKATTVLGAAKVSDAIVVGPGWGQSPANKKTLLSLLKLETNLVVDADALNLLSTQKAWPATKAKCVLTPHPGEMQRLAKALRLGTFEEDDQSRLNVAAALAKKSRSVVVLKGFRTVVVDGTTAPAASKRTEKKKGSGTFFEEKTPDPSSYLNATGDSSLSKAGTGDVLAGMIASLIGQGMSPYNAACLGVYLHGRAGEIAGQSLGPRSVLASDVIDAIFAAIRAYESEEH